MVRLNYLNGNNTEQFTRGSPVRHLHNASAQLYYFTVTANFNTNCVPPTWLVQRYQPFLLEFIYKIISKLN